MILIKKIFHFHKVQWTIKIVAICEVNKLFIKAIGNCTKLKGEIYFEDDSKLSI